MAAAGREVVSSCYFKEIWKEGKAAAPQVSQLSLPDSCQVGWVFCEQSHHPPGALQPDLPAGPIPSLTRMGCRDQGGP